MNILLISMYSDKWDWRKQHKLYRKAVGDNAKLIIKRYHDFIPSACDLRATRHRPKAK